MFFGVSALQSFHVLISLVAIAAGFVVVAGLLGAMPMNGLTAVFLATTLATLLTGFILPTSGLTPAVIVGIIATLAAFAAIFARYGRDMRGPWRGIYVVTAILSLYFNVFVLIAQLFQKVPSLNRLAPTGGEPPFAIAQGLVLVIFVAAGIAAWKRFRPAV